MNPPNGINNDETEKVQLHFAKMQLQNERDIFEQQVVVQTGKFENEQAKFDLARHGLELDKNNFAAYVAAEKAKLEHQQRLLAQRYPNIDPQNPSNNVIDQTAHSWAEKSQALDRKAGELATREVHIANLEQKLLVEKLQNEVAKRDVNIDQLKLDITLKESKITTLQEQLTMKDSIITEKNSRIDQLERDNHALCQRLEAITGPQPQIQAPSPHHIEAAFIENVSTYPIPTFMNPNPDKSWLIITIENLNKTIDLHFDPKKPILDVLWSDPYSALSSVLKRDYAKNVIPQKIDGKVKVFVSTKDVLDHQWIQITGDGCPLSPTLTSHITVKSLFKYNCTTPLSDGVVHNDRCAILSCSGRTNPFCQYRFDPDDGSLDNNCRTAHSPPTNLQSGHYHLKLKWVRD